MARRDKSPWSRAKTEERIHTYTYIPTSWWSKYINSKFGENVKKEEVVVWHRLGTRRNKVVASVRRIFTGTDASQEGGIGPYSGWWILGGIRRARIGNASIDIDFGSASTVRNHKRKSSGIKVTKLKVCNELFLNSRPSPSVHDVLNARSGDSRASDVRARASDCPSYLRQTAADLQYEYPTARVKLDCRGLGH